MSDSGRRTHPSAADSLDLLDRHRHGSAKAADGRLGAAGEKGRDVKREQKLQLHRSPKVVALTQSCGSREREREAKGKEELRKERRNRLKALPELEEHELVL